MKFWYYLIFVSGVAVLLAAVVLAALAQPVPLSFSPAFSQQSAVTSDDACLACHPAAYRYCDPALSLLAQTGAGGADAAAAHLSTSLTQTMAGTGSSAFLRGQSPFVTGRYDRQRYIVQTSGGYAVLPGVWSSQSWPEGSAEIWLTTCGLCHAAGSSLEAGVWNELNSFCKGCHSRGSIQSDGLQAEQTGTN